MSVEQLDIGTLRGRFVGRARGEADAPLVLCLHGFPDDASTFDDLLGRLAAQGYRAIAPFMRGYAPSPLEGALGFDALAADLLAMGDALSPDRPYLVVGHDFGAQAAYRALAAAPSRVARAVLLAGPHPDAVVANARRSLRQAWRSRYIALMQARGLAEWIVRRDNFAYVETLWRRWSPGFAPPAAHLAAVKRTIAASMPAPVEMYRAGSFQGDEWPIAVPTLLLLGRRDGCLLPTMATGQERYFTGPFKSETIEGVGHFLHHERPDLIAQKVIAWLRADDEG